MEHLASLEERDIKAGVFLNRVHWPLLTTYSLPFNLDNEEIFGFLKLLGSLNMSALLKFSIKPLLMRYPLVMTSSPAQ